jgi:NAD-dependent dihydropyrimidine dehydrogenase PreA subunit
LRPSILTLRIQRVCLAYMHYSYALLRRETEVTQSGYAVMKDWLMCLDESCCDYRCGSNAIARISKSRGLKGFVT